MYVFCSDLSFLSMQCDFIEVQSKLFTALSYAATKCFAINKTFVIVICMTKNTNVKKGQNSQIKGEKHD